MKYFIILLFVGLMCNDVMRVQAQINIASSENVLVVYNNSDFTSQSIANYYKNKRNIPEDNLLPLEIPTHAIIEGHDIYVVDYNEVIVDEDGNNNGNPNAIFSNTMQFVKLYITQPIEDYLNNTSIGEETLADIIKFIVVCKGIPFKATSWLMDFGHVSDFSRRGVSVDALISIINQSDPNFSITNSSFISSSGTSSSYINPYHGIEVTDGEEYNFNFRFKTKTYVNGSGIELNYLVSRLDGYDYNDVVSMIDRSFYSDMSGENVFVLDGDLNSYTGLNVSACRYDVIAANQELIELNFFTDENESDIVILNTYGNCIGYESSGSHSDALLYADYCVDVLEFNYSNGAIFNTYESFNGYAFDVRNLGDNQTYFGKRQGHVFPTFIHYQGLVADFIHAGGVGGEAHVYEPSTITVSDGEFLFPAYAMGYSLVEAIYMGIPYLAFRNLVVGDPLTTIAWGKQELTQYLTTWSDRNLVTGEITIPMYKTLTIENDSYIELRHQGFIPCNPSLGRMNIGQNVTFETDDWQRALFLSYDSENARIIWADHPTFPAILYNVYRKINDDEWEYIASTMDNEYTDEEVFLTCYECPINAIVHYFVKGVDAQEIESEASNEVSAEVIARIPKESANNSKGLIYEYSLSQNYPNPFNPSTKIDFSIKLANDVIIKVYDVLGNEIATLVNEIKEPGNYSVVFDAGKIPSGIYFYKLTSGSFTETKKLLLLK